MMRTNVMVVGSILAMAIVESNPAMAIVKVRNQVMMMMVVMISFVLVRLLVF